MPATRKIRWGVLGYARIAQNALIPAIQRTSNSVFAAIASRDTSKLAACRERFGEVRAHTAYDTLLADPEIDAIYIPLPNSHHRDWTIKAAHAGKHILCEKPIALNTAQAREMIDTCAAARVTLMEAFMYRYTARTQLVLDILRSGALGEIRHIESTHRFHLANPASIKLHPELGGGALYDVGCYPINFIGMVMDIATNSDPGCAPAPVSVTSEKVIEKGIDIIFSGLLRYPNGTIATLHTGFNAHPRNHSVITGTQGILEIPDTFLDTPGKLTLTTTNPEPGNMTTHREFPVPESDRYRSEVEDFAAALLENRPPLHPLTETLRNAGILDRLIAAK